MPYNMWTYMITLYFEQVLDEADRLLNEDFEKSLNEILQLIPRDQRIFLLSATMTKKIEAASKYSTVDTLKQQYRFLPAKHKYTSGKKLPEYPAQEEEVLLLEERVSEAKRLAVMKMKESGGKKKRRGEDNDGEDIDKSFGLKNGKSSKKFRR
ncbi:hypothetical protein Fmac_032465 [Flemingia macrophylla]|uniref:Helicase ATP-binding domain-containing protein n=1 Tax=Flemingia macrophylla TaxID=520843 RepID=A0ABD1L502_9FABA